jgi:hypothetical protein
VLRYLPPVASDQGPVGLAEFTAALSLAADQAAGLSLEHGLRTCLLATRLARRAGLAADGLRQVYYTALLRSVGCTSDAHERAELFGDEIAARTRLNLAPHLPTRELLGVLARHSGARERPVRVADPAGTFVYADSTGNAFTFTAGATSFGAGSGSHGSLGDLKIVPGQAVMLASNAVSAEPVS